MCFYSSMFHIQHTLVLHLFLILPLIVFLINSFLHSLTFLLLSFSVFISKFRFHWLLYLPLFVMCRIFSLFYNSHRITFHHPLLLWCVSLFLLSLLCEILSSVFYFLCSTNSSSSVVVSMIWTSLNPSYLLMFVLIQSIFQALLKPFQYFCLLQGHHRHITMQTHTDIVHMIWY